MTEIYIPADRLTLDGTGIAAGSEFPVTGNFADQGLTAGGGTPVTRGTMVGFRCCLQANDGDTNDTVTIRVYRSNDTRQTLANPGEMMVEIAFEFPDTEETLTGMLPDMEYPFFEQPFITAEADAEDDTQITVTPLLKAIT